MGCVQLAVVGAINTIDVLARIAIQLPDLLIPGTFQFLLVYNGIQVERASQSIGKKLVQRISDRVCSDDG